ncbi:MAG: AraC family transcriptional regulator [SAR86 cluster bacterium]|uniref:AraC family transcriptional regulator n=1 Tax=SAR86 cluster bacterium TaxID=2030880 RepID=A0A2A5B2N9_9GAMM|nr:MAG: AraC family transcriptional regulator [SAR86 cluster bacterium]
MKHVTIIAVPKALGSTVTIPLEMLSAANDIAKARRQLNKLVSIELASGSSSKDIVLSGGLSIQCNSNLWDITASDLIFVPGVWGNPRSSVKKLTTMRDWLKTQYLNGSTICSTVTGSYFLAEAGLLDGKAATTHWRFFDEFQQQYPKVKLQRKRFITSANKLFCTGSVNAVRDVMLYFVEQLYGESIADEISRQFTHELKRSFESLLLHKDQKRTHHDEEIIKVQEWLYDHFQEPIQIGKLAGEFQLSVRSLNRRFKLATNTTPLQYLQELRIDHAKELLKQSNLVISEIADLVGYQDVSYFTGLFKNINSVTPNEYRSLVRNKLFLAESKQQPI